MYGIADWLALWFVDRDPDHLARKGFCRPCLADGTFDCSLSINLAVLPLFSVSIAANRISVPGVVTLILGALNVVAAYLMATQTSHGVFGVAISGVLILTIKNAVFTPAYAASNLSLPWKTFVGSLFIVSMATGFVTLLSWCLAKTGRIDSWLFLIGSAIVVASVYAIVYLSIPTPRQRSTVPCIAIRSTQATTGLHLNLNHPQRLTLPVLELKETVLKGGYCIGCELAHLRLSQQLEFR